MDVKKITEAMVASYATDETGGKHCVLPERKELIGILDDLQRLMFPACFATKEAVKEPEHFAESMISSIYFRLKKQISLAFSCGCAKRADGVADEVMEALPEVRRVLLTDLQATFEGDPAAKSKEEIAFSYPGIYAIFVYRIAHLLYEREVPFIPRMMTEYAHGRTGIDINPGATIGEYFFIDHGTGIVIGETTTIGSRVKLYQGVTLGAKSFELDEDGNPVKGIKRHPDIGNGVVIYANATILGGKTKVGDNAVIGGNVWLTHSVAEGETVYYQK